MKVVILAGGLGSRLEEETVSKPKPMVEIGGRPILWHIMKSYSQYGLHDFVICLGYKGYMIKEYFANYILHSSDVTVDISKNEVQIHDTKADPWRVTLVDTGEKTMTGGRLKRVGKYLTPNEPFCMTYGDGVGDVDIPGLIAFHKKHGMQATVTATRPPGRFGSMAFEGDRVARFEEKPLGDGGWINGGFFVLSPEVLSTISGDSSIWEREPMEQLTARKQMMAFKHDGFWQPMDTLRDKNHLEELWRAGKAPWKVWS